MSINASLDMADFVVDDTSGISYTASSVVQHIGDRLSSGHCTAHVNTRSVPTTEQWALCNDSNVNRGLDISQSSGNDAYIAFYRQGADLSDLSTLFSMTKSSMAYWCDGEDEEGKPFHKDTLFEMGQSAFWASKKVNDIFTCYFLYCSMYEYGFLYCSILIRIRLFILLFLRRMMNRWILIPVVQNISNRRRAKYSHRYSQNILRTMLPIPVVFSTM